ncbi:MAG: transporter [Phenylobacterium sp.]|uniref:TolC family protein n=1 Tax=Phenylobacterium sp. TaxID=1871053 RepID=UPI0026262869|nr:TolC family protein [Phenylobacterium sp.]MDB5499668.1 transporter [Phenylobacterium sp.]
MSPTRWLPPLAVAACLAGPVEAGPLSYDQALTRALTSAPGLEAANLQAQAARAAAPAAGALPDPKLNFAVEGFPVSGPNAGRPSRDDFSDLRLGVLQDVPNAGRRRAAVAGARAEISQADAERAAEMRKVKVGAALAWIDLAYAQRRLAALDEVLKALTPLWEAQPSAVAAGRSRPGQALSPVEMRASLEDRRSEIAAAVGRAGAELTRWTGEPAPAAVGAPPHYPIDDAALRAALEEHPTILASRSAVQRAEAEVDAARAARRPDWSWELAYQRRDPMFGDMVMAGVTVSLPIFARTRQEPLIAARRAEASKAAAEREDARRALAAQFDGDLADHVMHHEQWTRTLNTVLPAAQQRADLETQSYAAGRANLADVLDAMTALANAKLAALEREGMVMRDGARIVLTYGNDQ